ncbi:MAG TPA: hypothetical protein VE779_06645 [Candidatus Angelobacter sp.]|nr:hypothetical protein [Candidatus Angelobacter sp.]
MPKSERRTIQIRLTDADRRRIKSLAAKQGMTLQDAILEAFDAWSEKLRTGGPNHGQPKSRLPQPFPPESLQPPNPPSWAWLARAVQLDWSQCPEVELVGDGTNELWLLRGTDAPVTEVLGALADGIPEPKIAEIFEIPPPQLARVIQFAAPPRLQRPQETSQPGPQTCSPAGAPAGIL